MACAAIRSDSATATACRRALRLASLLRMNSSSASANADRPDGDEVKTTASSSGVPRQQQLVLTVALFPQCSRQSDPPNHFEDGPVVGHPRRQDWPRSHDGLMSERRTNLARRHEPVLHQRGQHLLLPRIEPAGSGDPANGSAVTVKAGPSPTARIGHALDPDRRCSHLQPRAALLRYPRVRCSRPTAVPRHQRMPRGRCSTNDNNGNDAAHSLSPAAKSCTMRAANAASTSRPAT